MQTCRERTEKHGESGTEGGKEGRGGEDKGKQMDRVSQRCGGFKTLSVTKERERNPLAGNNRMKWHEYEVQVYLPGQFYHQDVRVANFIE